MACGFWTPISAGPASQDEMTPHLTIPQLTFLIGTALLIVIALVVTVYLLHKAFRRQLQEAHSGPAKLRAANETMMVLSTLQSTIANLKEQHQKAQNLLRTATSRGDEKTRALEILVQELEHGVVVFDRDGYISLSNATVRQMLEIDTWSRRRYTEVLGADSELTGLVGACLENGRTTRREKINYRTARGETRLIPVSIIPLQMHDGRIEGAICLFGVTQTAGNAGIRNN
jgi:signal transduction histidine kinase